MNKKECIIDDGYRADLVEGATFDGILYGPTNNYTVTDIVTKGDMIDIGVPGVLFASCNLGADSPEQVGNKYSWGSVIPSNNDFDNNYPFITYRLFFFIF